MEPLSIVALSASVGGVAGKVIEKAWDSGEKWLGDKFKSHEEKALEKAKENGFQFMEKLAQRLHFLEQVVKDDQLRIGKIEHSLEDPDFSASFQKALMSSARTNDQEKHKLFSRILVERLEAKDESLLKVTIDMTIDVVNRLTANQLRILALATVIYCIRPTINYTSLEQYKTWMEKVLGCYTEVKMDSMDILHLTALSCVDYQQFISRDIVNIFKPKHTEIQEWKDANFFNDNEVGKKILLNWKNKIEKIYPNSLGQTIGIFVHDELTETKTTITW